LWWLFGLVALLVLFTSAGDEIGDAIVELTTSDESRLSQMQPDAETATRQLIAQLAGQGMKVHVGQTFRTPAQEKSAIDSGHSGVKTHSWHELGRAVDLYPIDPDTGSPDLNGTRLDLFQQMHAVAESIGFHSIAFNADGTRHLITNNAGKKIWDGGHLEWRPPYGTIAEAWQAEGPDATA